jgi:hypothetical protein
MKHTCSEALPLTDEHARASLVWQCFAPLRGADVLTDQNLTQ